MTKCSEACTPICDFCKFAIHERGFTAEDGWFDMEPKACKLHPEETRVDTTFGCDDFYCIRVDRKYTRS